MLLDVIQYVGYKMDVVISLASPVVAQSHSA